ncbi:NACHT domain-containing protein [Streptomyces cyaneofuscatus]|uniref:NACHT domain-containing protein n=1 Tax=Streptomyces cyaneofuscatus TaxID=66883 RepID=UPI0033F356D3
MSSPPTPVTHLADRTVAVSGALQGSGVLLTDRLVLTCAHVVKTGSVLIAHPALPGRIRATVTWIDYRLDVALLEATEPVSAVPPARLGVLDTREAIPGCEITGFPRVQRYGGGLRKRLEVDQYTVTVLPMAGRVRDLLVCDLDGPPAARPDDEPPALSGLSGGPLFAGDILLGIARQVPQQREGRRVECVPLGPVLAAEPFVQAYRRTGALLREERVHGNSPRDLRYEAEYARALGVAYRRTKIFGLDELSRHDAEWDLDTAYLSLEAQAQDRSVRGRAAPEQALPLPQRIDTLLTDRPRVLLRGDAGAGKTTLLWWLAAHASARTLDDDLAPLNGLVPFVVPLRTLRAKGGTFPGPAELSGSAGLVVDAAPEGWAGRVLASGRALLLVDGLDEVPPEDREQAHDWLSQLLRRYPETRCVATVRPLAVEPDWLRSEGFAELRLLPMRNEDVRAFVTSWHRAARLSEQDDADRLDELQQDLSRQFDQNPTLRDLARTPLLCAVICALHRRRDGFLPETRWELYRSALEMLLGRRDQRRRIGGPEGIELGIEESTQLLQRIAVWLAREGQSEFTRAQALRQLARALAGMERVSAQGPPERILTQLLNRSGLLQERTDDTYQFIHRTFQDYLAAKELIEDDHLNELLRHEDDAAWQDVILLASGHCSRRQLPVLIDGLLAAARTYDDGSDERAARHVRASLCAQHGTWLDRGVSERVRKGLTSLFPLDSDDQVRSLALLGTTALPHLPAAESCERNGSQAKLVVSLLGRIGGTETLAYARAWAIAHPDLARDFQYSWSRFPEQAYAREVLAHTDLASHYLMMRGREQALALRLLPAAQHIVIGPGITDADLRTATDGRRLRSLILQANDLLTDLTPLGQWADCLTHLQIQQCLSIQDLTPLADLTELTVLELDVANLVSLNSLTAIQALPSLDYLGLDEVDVTRFSDLPPHPGVSTLSLECMGNLSFDGLEAWESLTTLALLPYSGVDTALAGLAKAPQITALEAYAFPWEEADRLTPVPSIQALSLDAPPRSSRDLMRLRRLFPALTELELHVQPTQTELDLTPLAEWAGLQVTIEGLAPEKLLGAEQLIGRLYTS